MSREVHAGHHDRTPFRRSRVRRWSGVVETEGESFDIDFVTRRVGEEGVPKASICSIAFAVPENFRPADVCHHFGLKSNGHPHDIRIGEVGIVVVLQHRIESDRGDDFRVGWRDFDPSEFHFSVVEVLEFFLETIGADPVFPFQDPQLTLVSGPQEHLLLQAGRAIDAGSPTLRDSSDVEEIFEWEERQDTFEKFFCREDTIPVQCPLRWDR